MSFETFYEIVKDGLQITAEVLTIYQALKAVGKTSIKDDGKWLSFCWRFKKYVNEHPEEGIVAKETQKNQPAKYYYDKGK